MIMILNNEQLTKWSSEGGLSPFVPENVNPASIDLRWSGNVRVPSVDGWGDTYNIETLCMAHCGIYLLDTLEYVKMPLDCAGLLLSKTKMGRGGTFLGHVGWVDPGFEGTLTFQLHHVYPMVRTIHREERIVQLVLLGLVEAATLNYGEIGNYHGQSEPTVQK
jgi:dCTP deaminase